MFVYHCSREVVPLIAIDILPLVFIGCATIAAAMLRTFTGFGFALAAVPLLSLMLPPTDVVVLSACMALGLAVLSLRHFWGQVTLQQLSPLLVTALVGTWLGTLVLTRLPKDSFQVCVGVAVLLACFGMRASPTAGPKPSRLLPYGAGFLSGLMNGAMAIPGPPVIVYALYAEPEPLRSRALMMAFFGVSAVFALCSFTAQGMVRQQTLLLALLSLPALYLGDRCGAWLFSRYADAFYRKVALWVLVALGCTITLKGLF